MLESKKEVKSSFIDNLFFKIPEIMPIKNDAAKTINIETVNWTRGAHCHLFCSNNEVKNPAK